MYHLEKINHEVIHIIFSLGTSLYQSHRSTEGEGWVLFSCPYLQQQTFKYNHESAGQKLTCKVNWFNILVILSQMRQYSIFLSLKPKKVTSNFILNVLKKKFARLRHHSEVSKTNLKTIIPSLWISPWSFRQCQSCRCTNIT